MAKLTENRLEIRSKKYPPGEQPVAFGSQLEVLFNGQPLGLWQRISLDLTHDTFVVADITIAVGELVVDAEAALILSAAAREVVAAPANGE